MYQSNFYYKKFISPDIYIKNKNKKRVCISYIYLDVIIRIKAHQRCSLYSARVLIGPNPTPTSISRTPNQVCLWNPKARAQLLLCIADRCKGHFSLSSLFAFKILLVRHKNNTTQVQRLRFVVRISFTFHSIFTLF